MAKVLTFTQMADSRYKKDLDKVGLLVDVDRRVKSVQKILENLGTCTVTITEPEFVEWEHEKCMQWRMQMTVSKKPKVGCWDTILAAILAVTPVRCKFVNI